MSAHLNGFSRRLGQIGPGIVGGAKRQYLWSLSGEALVWHCKLASVGILEDPGPIATRRNDEFLQAVSCRVQEDVATAPEWEVLWNEELEREANEEGREGREDSDDCAAMYHLELWDYYHSGSVAEWFTTPDGFERLVYIARGLLRNQGLPPDKIRAELLAASHRVWLRLVGVTSSRLGISREELTQRLRERNHYEA